MRKLTQQQRGFGLDIIKEIPAGQAYLNHYRVKSKGVADSCATKLLRTAQMAAFLSELRLKMEDEAIAGPIERKKILTEIARGRVVDYTKNKRIEVTEESPNTAAIQELGTSELIIGKSAAGLLVEITKLKLHNPMQAIDLLNKMEKLYADGFEPTGANKGEGVTILNVINFDATTVAAAILEAEQLGISAALLGGNGQGEDATLVPSSTDVQTTPVPEPEK